MADDKKGSDTQNNQNSDSSQEDQSEKDKMIMKVEYLKNSLDIEKKNRLNG